MDLWESWLEKRKERPCHRQLVVLSGSESWCNNTALNIVKQVGNKALWLGDSDFFTVRGYPVKQYKKLLGQECQIAIYDGHSGVFPSAYLALTGTLKSGGLQILCIPDWRQWAGMNNQANTISISHGYSVYHSRFIQRWQALMVEDKTVSVISETLGPLHVAENAPVPCLSEPVPKPFATRDQEDVFNAIINGKGQHNAIITARRGRGKSALLGLLADHFVKRGRNVILVTAHKTNADSVFSHAQSVAAIRWMAPDNPVLQTPTDLLLVDEVASLPVSQTLDITGHCQHYILATTTEGYEGTGRGFYHKLLPQLRLRNPDVSLYHMQSPIRYFPQDSLEQHNDQVFLLRQPTDISHPESIKPQDTQINLYTNTLEVSEGTLQNWFSLLSHAHYQTTPEDIIRILDSPDNFVVTLTHGAQLVGIAVICVEGAGRLGSLAEDIAAGARRAKGHLFAQKLSLLMSDSQVLSWSIWRINRIAIQPGWHSRGFGSMFLTKIQELAFQQSVDIVAASFGANVNTRKFWLGNKFLPVHQGSAPDKTTGETSLFVMKLLKRLDTYSSSDLRALYESDYEQSDTLPATGNSFVQKVYQRRLLDYFNDTRSYLHLGKALTFWLKSNSKVIAANTELQTEFDLLTAKWLEDHSEKKIQQDFNFNGRKKLYVELKAAFIRCYLQINTL